MWIQGPRRGRHDVGGHSRVARSHRWRRWRQWRCPSGRYCQDTMSQSHTASGDYAKRKKQQQEGVSKPSKTPCIALSNICQLSDAMNEPYGGKQPVQTSKRLARGHEPRIRSSIPHLGLRSGRMSAAMCPKPTPLVVTCPPATAAAFPSPPSLAFPYDQHPCASRPRDVRCCFYRLDPAPC